MKEDIKALKLVSRFSLPPNSLGYCGKTTAPERLNSCVIKGDCEGVSNELENFIVLNPYLKTISEISGKPRFGYEVIECYCIGNELSGKFDLSGYDLLLKNFISQGVPDFFVDELKCNPPKTFIPTHLFQVLYVGVGKASGSVLYNMDTINNCMVRWGEVKNISNDKITVDLNMLEGTPEDKLFKLVKKEETFSFNKLFVPKLKVGSIVAVHWQQVIKILTKQEVKNIEYWTKKVLNSF